MAKGYLQVMVTSQTAIPLKDVKITVIDGNSLKVLEDKEMTTDANGQSGTIELETVAKSYSLDENNTEILPYANYNLIVEKDGFMKGEIVGVQIFDEETSFQTIGLLPRPTDYGNGFERDSILGDVEKLFDVQEDLQEGQNTYVLGKVVIPKSVTVHLGKPNEPARNVTVPFMTYLKSVASSEIYPTWPYEALKANILCHTSFVLNRIYTEWYRSRGYNFDITNSTSYDQKYIHARSTFASTDRIVERVFNNYVTKKFNKEPYFTEYCDGKQVTCKGLKQWGTVDRAKEGMKAEEILKYYYGDNIQINQSDDIANVPSSYPGTALRRGSTGQNVQVIQAQLNRISDNYPSIKKQKVDGIFGANTETAVKEFQRIFKLNPDGVVGKATWYKLSYIYVAVKKLAELTSEGEAIKDGAYPGYVIKRGDRGLNVTIIQFYINQAAQYISSLNPVKMDGIFGSDVEKQVKNFQRYFNLTADGKVGVLTWTKMQNIYLSIANGVDIPQQIPPDSAKYPGYLLRVGSSGKNVTRIQQWLNGISEIYPSIPSINADGKFGYATQKSVISFQNKFGLSPDGIVGNATWNRIYNVWQDLVAQNLI